MATNFIFVDEAGDPGQPFTLDASGQQIPTGASSFYIITAMCINEDKLFKLEDSMMELKLKFGYKKEIKSNEISLKLYAELLDLVNKLDICTFYRLVDKSVYKGTYKVDGHPILHNVFDEYNVARAVAFAIVTHNLKNVDIVIDRTDRRRFDGKFDSFNTYLTSKVNKYIQEETSIPSNIISHITHVDSKYVNAMQMSDLICGAIRENFTKKNEELIRIIDPKRLVMPDGKYERKLKKTKDKAKNKTII